MITKIVYIIRLYITQYRGFYMLLELNSIISVQEKTYS